MIWPLLLLLVMPGCAGLLEAATGILADPAVQDGMVQTVTSAATGSWTGTLWGLGATIAAVCAYKTTKKKPKLEGE